MDSDAEFGKLVKELGANQKIEQVNLRYKLLSPDQLSNLFTALKSNTHVTSLVLSGNDLTKSVPQLAEALKANTSITDLDLRFAELKDEHGKMLIPAIKERETQFKELRFLGNKLSSDVEKELKALTGSSSSSIRSSSEHSKKKDRKSARGSTSKRSSRTSRKDKKDKKDRSRHISSPVTAGQGMLDLENVRRAIEAEGQEEAKKARTMTINCDNTQICEKLADAGGSNASVYSCLVDGWQCVMKELDLKGVSPQLIKQFEREIGILEELPFHNNIVRYLFHERKGEKLRLFVTRYTCSLGKVIRDRRREIEKGSNEPWSPYDIAKYCVDITNGLEFLHKHHVIHRDLKSDNVFVNLNVHNEIQQLAIGDFDTAKIVQKKDQAAKTIIGTPGYMAPEVYQAQSKGAYSFAADVWSLGMVLYELLTLKQPYEDEDLFEVPLLVAKGQRPAIPDDWPGVAECKGLIKLYKDCTKVDPTSRPTVSQLKEKLYKISWSHN